MERLASLLFYGFQDFQQVVPYHLHCGNEQALVGGVDTSEGGTERHHVHVGITLREETALQTGMDAQNLWILAEEFTVGVNHELRQLAVGVHLPCRIAVALLHLGACQLEQCLHGIGHVAEVAHHVGALTGNDGHRLVTALHAGHIAAGFHQPRDFLVLAHGQHAVVKSLKGTDDACGGLGRQNKLGVNALHGELHCGVGYMVFLCHVGGKDVPGGFHFFFLVERNAEHHGTVARDGVVHLAGVETGETAAILLVDGVKEACKDLDGVGPLLVDVIAECPPQSPFNVALMKNCPSGAASLA